MSSKLGDLKAVFEHTSQGSKQTTAESGKMQLVPNTSVKTRPRVAARRASNGSKSSPSGTQHTADSSTPDDSQAFRSENQASTPSLSDALPKLGGGTPISRTQSSFVMDDSNTWWNEATEHTRNTGNLSSNTQIKSSQGGFEVKAMPPVHESGKPISSEGNATTGKPEASSTDRSHAKAPTKDKGTKKKRKISVKVTAADLGLNKKMEDCDPVELEEAIKKWKAEQKKKGQEEKDAATTASRGRPSNNTPSDAKSRSRSRGPRPNEEDGRVDENPKPATADAAAALRGSIATAPTEQRESVPKPSDKKEDKSERQRRSSSIGRGRLGRGRTREEPKVSGRSKSLGRPEEDKGGGKKLDAPMSPLGHLKQISGKLFGSGRDVAKDVVEKDERMDKRDFASMAPGKSTAGRTDVVARRRGRAKGRVEKRRGRSIGRRASGRHTQKQEAEGAEVEGEDDDDDDDDEEEDEDIDDSDSDAHLPPVPVEVRVDPEYYLEPPTEPERRRSGLKRQVSDITNYELRRKLRSVGITDEMADKLRELGLMIVEEAEYDMLDP